MADLTRNARTLTSCRKSVERARQVAATRRLFQEADALLTLAEETANHDPDVRFSMADDILLWGVRQGLVKYELGIVDILTCE